MDADGRDVENGIEISSVEQDAEEAILEEMACATRLLGVGLPIVQANILSPSGISKIQKVPALLRQNPNFASFCSPEMMSFGPMHHHRQNGDLQLGQQFKYLWAFRYITQFACSRGRQVEDSKRFLYETVTQHIQLLRDMFSEDVTKGYNDKELAQMLFVDGCALLYFMKNVDDSELVMLKFDQLWCIWKDIILLENQLPAKLLYLLIGDSPVRYKNIGDLKKAGIQVKVSQTDEWKWLDISFTSNLFRGHLMLPRIVINDLTRYLYHNLIAYEMCPDFRHGFEFYSFFSLMDSFIDDAEDVKELREAGVLENSLGNDEEVAKFFNELGHVLLNKISTTIINMLKSSGKSKSIA
ncbi:uncharacterized protein [Arachis hypogaea]|uniref:uncharacterized protein n=1 Tax=Arachis hypogaea TaxID=3818 RepID=UPI003B20C63F